MASKLIKARKRQLLSDLEEKRNAIKVGAVNLQETVGESTKDLVARPQLGNSRLIHERAQPSTSALSLISSATGFTDKINSFTKSQSVRKVIRTAHELKNRTVVRAQQGENSPETIKLAVLGCGSVFILGSLLAKSSKRKKRKKESEEAKIAKMGIGFLLFKWLLSASQPAVKYAITKKVKNGILR